MEDGGYSLAELQLVIYLLLYVNFTQVHIESKLDTCKREIVYYSESKLQLSEEKLTNLNSLRTLCGL